MANITINNVTHKAGWFWINEGVRYFVQAKQAWMMCVFSIGMISVLLTSIAPILQLSLIFILPFFSASLAIACVDLEKGQKLSVNYIFKAFSSTNRFNLFRYGILLMILIIFAQLINSIFLGIIGISPEQLNQALTEFKNNEAASFQTLLETPVLFKFLVTTFILMIPVSIINLLSPIILVFSELTAFQALKLSLQAGIKNFSAFIYYVLVFIIVLAILFVFFKIIISLLLIVFGENSKVALIIYFSLFVTCLLVVASISYSSAYVAYKDIFIEK